MNKKPTILVVDDEIINRLILKKLLADSYDVVEAANGKDALDLLDQGPARFSAMLLDIMMPVMNGYRVLEQLPDLGLSDLPVMVMTADSDEEAERKALDAGAWDFVGKPFNARVLKSRLRNAIARSQVSFYQKMQYVAEHDRLTGLMNRGCLFRVTREMLDANPDEKFAFARIDIDRFALFNQSFGEEAGDALLKRMADIISGSSDVFPHCTYGRVSGDVFCLCLPYNGDPEPVAHSVQFLQKKLSDYRKDYALDVSVGVYVIDDPALSVEEMFIRAGLAAQSCKNQYDKHLAFYNSADGKRAANAVMVTAEMQTALDEKQFLVYYQPKFDLSTDTVCGAEALVRWKHPTRGLIPPGDFIPVFESNGFVARLDYYVWEQTCRDLRRWCDAGVLPFPVSVNISRISLYNPKLVELITGLVKKYNISPTLLQLEVTESAYMTNPDLMKQTISALHKAGFTILMDDFGSGYSSLNTLKSIEMDVLKIDMKFLPVEDETEKGEIILASIIRMANWLGMAVVVEGVETKPQRDFLESTGADSVQGYFYSRPIPCEEYEQNYVFGTHIPGPEEAAPARNEDAAPLHNVTLLVIDDSELDRELLRSYFGGLFHVHCCNSAEDGLLYLKHHQSRVRLILVDNIMPGMSGLDFLIYCQSNSVLRAIPQIMITAADNVDSQVAAFRAGAYDYITKPLVKEIVQARVDHVMDISHQYRNYENDDKDARLMASRDAATGLLNKPTFADLTNRFLQTDPGTPRALLALDIDNFKLINDHYGHLDGDAVIRSLALEMSRIFHRSDLLGRFGGDEFVVLMNGLSDTDTARRKSDDLIRSFTISCSKDLGLSVSVSIGIAFYEEGDTMDTLFKRADLALYDSKNTGKGKAVIYGEQVPPILDDNKPVVLICGDDPQLYPAIALSYGDGAAFANITSLDTLKATFENYRPRIRAICIDTQKRVMEDSDAFLQYITEQGGGTTIPMLAVYKEGDMANLRHAASLKIQNVLSLPPQIDVIQRRLSHAIALGAPL